ncbi:MAG: ABC transporter ATP-binding protein [Paralcaligenes sp.]
MKQGLMALRVTGLSKTFDISAPLLNRIIERKPEQYLKAVDDVSFTVPQGGCLSLVGESGCGKSTLARLVVGLFPPSAGEIHFTADDTGKNPSIQMIFQDPHASLNPRWRVVNIIAEPIRELKLRQGEPAIKSRVAELLKIVGLYEEDGQKFPHEFSGGQRQRISIARALAGEPQFLVCDEPTSALDVSVQAQILNLMRDLQDELGLTYLFISHDLSVVRHMSDRIAVMYLGRIVEEASTEVLFETPQHPYTKLLLATIPNLVSPNRTREVASGEIPSPIDAPPGCSFHPRCPLANHRCTVEKPRMRELTQGTRVACHAVEEGRTS